MQIAVLSQRHPQMVVKSKGIRYPKMAEKIYQQMGLVGLGGGADHIYIYNNIHTVIYIYIYIHT